MGDSIDVHLQVHDVRDARLLHQVVCWRLLFLQKERTVPSAGLVIMNGFVIVLAVFFVVRLPACLLGCMVAPQARTVSIPWPSIAKAETLAGSAGGQ